MQSRGVVNPLHFAPKAKRVIFLYQAGGPSHLETFDYKPKLAEMTGKPMPESFTKRTADRAAPGTAADLLRADARLQAVRQVGAGDLRAVPAHRQHHRRDLHRPLDVDRADQPRSGAHVHEHRIDHHRPPEHGLVGAVRAGRGDRKSARLRRAGVAGQRRADAADRSAAMVGRHSAQQIPGREVQLGRRSGALHHESARHQPRHAEATRSTRSTR